jgi:poly-gamma-glutamate synthesis protein (capsule biosynthesis protein)
MANPAVLDDLKEQGFHVLNIANNHTLDYCQKGLEATIRNLKDAGMTYVGAGRNLAEAALPKYVECREGRVAFIGITSSYHDTDAAGPQGGIVPGRPGINPLRRIEYYEVTEENYQALSKIAEETGMNDGYKWAIANGYRNENENLFLRELKFVKGECNRMVNHPLPADMERMKNAIQEARLQADCVVVSFHSHQMSGSADKPAPFIVEFCHACIDAGANVIFGHGSHELRGLEIYKNAPIFYGLNEFILHNEMQEVEPFEFYERVGQEPSKYDYVGLGMNLRSKGGTCGLCADHKAWESVAASISMKDHEVKEVRVYPLSLGFEKSRAQRGWPVIDKTGKILDNFCKLSNNQYGTQFELADGYAKVIL